MKNSVSKLSRRGTWSEHCSPPPPSPRTSRSSRLGFTLVELLVVIAIIGILVALLLPAIQAAREAARRSQCKNHLKQLGLGSMLHEDAHKFLPSGGWTKFYTADSNLGFGAQQPGSWYFNILPYTEEATLHDIMKGVALGTPQFEAASTKLHQTPVTIFNCPSRRAAQLYPHAWGSLIGQGWVQNLSAIVKGDYAANSGDSLTHAGNGFGSDQLWHPTSYAIIKTGPFSWSDTGCTVVASRGSATPIPPRFCQSGVIHYRSEIKVSQINDGTTNTYLIGEKFLSPEMYETASATNKGYGDNQGAWSGFEWDNHRVAWNPTSANAPEDYQPRQDTIGVDNPNIYAFGSAHAGSMNMAMCDGSVQAVSYDIDRDIHRFLASRLDGNSATLP